MIVGTTEAAQILNITTARLRVLLIAGRVEGAYKTGRMWLMPLFNGKPLIKRRGKRGPAPRWCNPKTPAKTIVHVNSHKIKANHKHKLQEPVITVKKPSNSSQETSKAKGNLLNLYGHEVEILGGCRVVYNPDKPKFGAKVYIETLSDVIVNCWD